MGKEAKKKPLPEWRSRPKKTASMSGRTDAVKISLNPRSFCVQTGLPAESYPTEAPSHPLRTVVCRKNGGLFNDIHGYWDSSGFPPDSLSPDLCFRTGAEAQKHTFDSIIYMILRYNGKVNRRKRTKSGCRPMQIFPNWIHAKFLHDHHKNMKWKITGYDRKDHRILSDDVPVQPRHQRNGYDA